MLYRTKFVWEAYKQLPRRKTITTLNYSKVNRLQETHKPHLLHVVFSVILNPITNVVALDPKYVILYLNF